MSDDMKGLLYWLASFAALVACITSPLWARGLF